MARGGASGVHGGVGSGCGCGCGDPAGHNVSGGCTCGCSTSQPQTTMEEIAQLEEQRSLINRRLEQLKAS